MSLRDEVRRELEGLDLGQVRVLSRIDHPGEVMVLLAWPSETDAHRSAVAQALVQDLQRRGLVSYSAWACPLALDELLEAERPQ